MHDMHVPCDRRPPHDQVSEPTSGSLLMTSMMVILAALVAVQAEREGKVAQLALA